MMIGQPFSKNDIIAAWMVEGTAVHNFFAAIEPPAFLLQWKQQPALAGLRVRLAQDNLRANQWPKQS